MSDFDDPNNPIDPANEPPNVRQQRERIKELTAENKDLVERAARADQLERELALRDAGLDLNERQRKALSAVHEGDWTPERLRETATDLGIPVPQPTPPVPPEVVSAGARMDQASAGAQIGAFSADADLDARLRGATSEAEFDRIYRESGRPMR